MKILLQLFNHCDNSTAEDGRKTQCAAKLHFGGEAREEKKQAGRADSGGSVHSCMPPPDSYFLSFDSPLCPIYTQTAYAQNRKVPI